MGYKFERKLVCLQAASGTSRVFGCLTGPLVPTWPIAILVRITTSGHEPIEQRTATIDLQKDAKALGLKSPVATPAAVRAAYLRKAKASHPDAGGTKQEFQNIQAAYERLGTQRRHQARIDERYYSRRPNDIIDRINHRLSRSVTRSRK